jgi:D-glutamate cyclase-like protein
MIDHLMALDPGGRGIAAFFVRGGASAAARALRRSRRVLLTTGFAVGPGLPETDGPPGTACLGRALRILGAEVIYVTDAMAVPPLQAALKVLGEPAAVETFHVAHGAGGGPAARGARETARRLLAEHRPTHMVAIERPGRARDGEYRSARGRSLTEWNGALDELFLAAPARIVTVGVGDGGNEIGMGAVRARVARAGGLFPRIASVVKVKHLVVAGVSNWGAYGIVAELGRLTGRPLLHTGEEEQAMVQACVDAGAVDGLTFRPEATVDGLPLPAHIGMLELLRVLESPRRTGGPSE